MVTRSEVFTGTRPLTFRLRLVGFGDTPHARRPPRRPEKRVGLGAA